MMSALELPEDGLVPMLHEAARRRGLRYSRAHVRALLERQERPGSLLSLVRAAPELGLKATAGQADLETLDTLETHELPAVLHFQTETHQGFGLLEAVLRRAPDSPVTFRLWDSAHGSREVERDFVARGWSGVVVFLEREGRGEPEPDYLRHRARELLFEEWRWNTALVGPASSPGLRWGGALLLALLLGLAVLRQPTSGRGPTALLALLSLLGAAASLAALTWTRGKGSRLCGTGGPIDCESILHSEWAHPAGVPLAGVGSAFFGSLLLVLCASALGGGSAGVWLVGAAFLPTLPLSAVLVAAQVRMRRLCTLCMGVHGVNLGGAAVFIVGVWRHVPSTPPGVGTAALLGVLFFGLLLSCFVPLVSQADETASRLEEHTRLLGSPLVTLARLAQESRLSLEGEALGPALGEADAPHELVAFVHPACAHCGRWVEELEALLTAHAHRVRVHFALTPMDPEDAGDVAACDALMAAGEAWGGAVFLQLFRWAKRDYTRLRQAEDPLALLATEAHGEPEALERALERARARVQEATRFKRRHVRGLPTLFFEGRRCEAPLAHVARWLDSPALLAVLSSWEPRTEAQAHPGAAHP